MAGLELWSLNEKPIIITEYGARIHERRYVRDENPEDDCLAFDPELILSEGCNTDGHYMCKHCASYDPANDHSLNLGSY